MSSSFVRESSSEALEASSERETVLMASDAELAAACA
jgi:hypothetical protein